MKKLFIITAISLMSTVTYAAIETVTFKITKMNCATCPVVVKGALYDLDGVDKVVTSLDDKTAIVTFDDEKLNVSDLMSATENAGFPAVHMSKDND